ncbi:glycoside hydrolase [Kineosporia rhizophila]|uniref:sialidase family protein n=1 Tax=Kineosporia rhizophila TaxID=84633 RepID=UPI001E3AF3E5|nr:sialidase family protein [Kineosporia rhizophila]MCE0538050.1 glycoside hydrolase [Kineosporia rhizophila]
MTDVTNPDKTLGDLLALELYSDQNVLVGGGRVRAWGDARGGGLTARQANPAARPIRVAGALNQHPAVRFTTPQADLADCFLGIPDAPELNPGKGPFRVLVVARNRSMETTGPRNTFLYKGNGIHGSTPAGYSMYLERISPASMGTVFRVRDVTGNAGARTHRETTARGLGAVRLYELALTGRDVRAALDGDFAAKIVAGGGGTDNSGYAASVTTSAPLRLGGVNRGVDLFAVLVIKGAVTERQLTDVRTYLVSRYSIPVVPAAVAPAGPEQTKVISTVEGGRARIPAIVRCADDSVVIFAEHRWDGDADSGHIGLVARRSTDGGQSWGEEITVVDDGENTRGNPVPVLDRSTGRLHLLLTGNLGTDNEVEINDGTAEDTRRVYRTFSDDHGVTWAPVREITDSTKKPSWRWYATGPGGARQLASGRLLVPCNHYDPARSAYRSHAIYSDDHGETWQLGGIVPTDNTNEIQATQLRDGTLRAHVRWAADNNPPGWKYVTTSTDEGLTWSPATPEYSLPSTPVQDDLITLPDGRLAATNHQDFTGRYNLAISTSPDDGRTWPAYTVVREGAVGDGAGYADLESLGGNRIAAVWEAGRQISVQLFDVV